MCKQKSYQLYCHTGPNLTNSFTELCFFLNFTYHFAVISNLKHIILYLLRQQAWCMGGELEAKMGESHIGVGLVLDY